MYTSDHKGWKLTASGFIDFPQAASILEELQIKMLYYSWEKKRLHKIKDKYTFTYVYMYVFSLWDKW